MKMEVKKEKYSFNWESIKKIHFLNKLIMKNWKSAIGVFFLLALGMGNEFIIYEIGNQSSKFYEIIGNKEHAQFSKLIYLLTFLVLLESITKSILNYIAAILSIWWRQGNQKKKFFVFFFIFFFIYFFVFFC